MKQASKPASSSQGKRTVAKVVKVTVPGVVVALGSNGGAEVMGERLDHVLASVEDMEPVFELFGHYLVSDHIAKQFKVQGNPRWAALSPRYAAWKAKHYPDRPILVRTGGMRDGFTWEAKPKSLRIVNRVKAGQARSSKPRWVYHQDGTPTMPARPMLRLGTPDYARLRAFVAQQIAVGTEGIE
jgi:hypothetical protein